MGTVYIAHFGQRIGNPEKSKGQAQHYVGYAEPWRFERRVREHLRGQGAKITRFVVAQGIPITFFPIKRGATKEDERRIKRAGHAPKLCPICSGRVTIEEPPF
jgi:predicted GIY-YIG superfamily endonuclease